ncbi:P-loop containing nucleoside triphosphate hydrolase protein [Zopfochytrium polystomum]|nr:P-loop containing nucleoside triphosphate hydrolase protein [Zopfochytrium polystomum]
MGFTYMIGKNRPTPLPPSYYFEWSHHMLAPLLGIFFQIVVLASILVLYELSGEIASWLRSQRSPMPHPIRPSSSEDVDVAQERARVELIEPGGSLDRFGITIKNLHKAFFSRLGNAAPAASSASVATDEEAAPLQPAVPTGRHEYPGPYGLWTNRTALRNLSLAVPRGELFTLLGPNGAGKTTALSLALAELRPVAGDVWLNATAGVGYAPQMDALWPAASVREHLVLFARLKGLRARPAASWAASAARTLNLADAMGKRVSQLSGGMKRKLGFALALVGAVDVLFLDEPSTGVDPAARRTMRAFLQARQHRFATFLTTHSMDEADALSTRIGILVNGALACIGSPGHLKRRFGNSYVLELVFNPAVAAPPLPVATDDGRRRRPRRPARVAPRRAPRLRAARARRRHHRALACPRRGRRGRWRPRALLCDARGVARGERWCGGRPRVARAARRGLQPGVGVAGDGVYAVCEGAGCGGAECVMVFGGRMARAGPVLMLFWFCGFALIRSSFFVLGILFAGKAPEKTALVFINV